MKGQALVQIKELVEEFIKNEDYYNNTKYKEAEARIRFIDPFFEALGWDISGKTAETPSEREVIIERSFDNEDETKKFVDYTFRINQKPQFLVEAKKPSEKLTNKKHIFQAKSYGFSMGVPFVILTNFKKMRLYDISTKPLMNQPKTDLVDEYDLELNQYEEKFEYIWNLFSKEAVQNKSLIKYYMERRNLEEEEIRFNLNYANYKGSSLLDKEFLNDLLDWRLLLAKNIYKNNSELEQNKINELVQRCLDRVVFLRILEDRKIENKEHLRKIVCEYDKNHIHNLKNELDNLFNKLNKEYNGLLFHRHKLLENIKIDDNVLKYIINKLYFPESPYNFKHIHVEILGRIFEQYLGNTITIKDGEVSIEIKEELKKAGGVYYTPEEIVEKIVNETISKDLSNITKKKLTNYKAIDITCGSGSFLIKIYKKIINHYEELYSSKKEYLKEAIENDMVFLDNNVINLTLKHKKKILENNIFGVDIDPQAVELTKMSLYITMLENTCKDKTTRPILPSLSDNIKCGNSIVSTDYYIGYEEYQESLDLQVRPFNWEQEFWKKGFNCIVGNPPYVRIQLLKDIYPESMTEYIKDKYDSAKHGNFDLSVVFVEKAIQLLNNKGRLGYIVLNKFFNTKYGLGLRKILSDGRTKYLDKILDFKDQQVFKGVTTYTCLLFLKREKTNNFSYAKVEDIDSWFLNRNANYEEKKYDKIGKKPWYFGNNQHQELKENLKDNTMKLSSIAKRIFVGVQTNCDEVFLLKKINKDGNIVYCESSYTGKVHPFEVDHIKKVLKGSDDIRKYKHSNNKRLIFPYDLGTSRPPVIEEQDYKDRHPLTWEYLNICKKRLKDRTEVKNGEINSWYEYRYRKNHSRFEQPKILLPSLCKGSRFSLDKNGEFYFTGSGQGGGGGYGLVLKENTVYNYYSLLGVMNSKVISYFIIHDGTPQSGGYQGIRKSFIEELLIPIINGDEVKKELLSEIGTKAKLLFNLNKNKISKTEGEKRLKMLNDTYNNEIDNLVYQLYELNEEEIKHIEEFMQ